MKEIELFKYQIPSVDALHDGFMAGHRSQMLMAPTGFGKTIVAADIMKRTAANGKRVAFIVDRVNLVKQTSEKLDQYGIAHGIIQGDHWRRNGELIQICSAQTIEKREFFPDLDLLIVDEAHAVRKQTARFIRARRDKMWVIGLSATPFKKGLADLYSNLVNTCTTNELLASGDLTPLKMYAAKTIDMKGAKTKAGGEWADKEVEDRGMKIIGDIVAEWQAKTFLHFGKPVKTIVFSATVEHGKELCRQFQEAGFNFQQVSYKDGSDDAHRDELIAEFRRPDSSIHGLVSCEVFTKGFDVEDILCGIAARPYRKSLSSHIQQMGRVMRKSPGKEFGLWLDHAGNLQRFRDDVARVFEHGIERLDDGLLDAKPRKEPTERENEQWTCSCGYVFLQALDKCPACGKERRRLNLVETVAGVLEAFGHQEPAKPNVPEYLVDKDLVWRQLCGMAFERKGDDFDAARRFAQRQYKTLYGHFSRAGYSPDLAASPTPELRKRVGFEIKKFMNGWRQSRAVS